MKPWTDPRVHDWARVHLPSVRTESLTTLATSARAALGDEAGRIALSLARVWDRHGRKFGEWGEFCADRTAAEQATGRNIALWRARRFADRHVLDLCCGAGSDTVALSLSTECVTAVDLDPDRLDWARFNVERHGDPSRVQFRQMDAGDPSLSADAALLDPDRRATGTRRVSTRHYAPTPDVWDAIRVRVPNLAVKVSPGIPYDEIPPESVSEFVEERGECREAVLWHGDLRPESRTATVVGPNGETMDTIEEHDPEELEIGEIGSVMYDPGPATVRAHLVTQLAARLGARRIDSQIAYLTGDDVVETPLASAFEVEEVWSFNLRRVREALRARDIGVLEILARRFPVSPDEMRKKFDLKGDESRSLILTKVKDRGVAVLCRRPI
jgi:SAM-dependent methyltransferase